MHTHSLVERSSILSTLARVLVRVALLAGMLGIFPAASAQADAPVLTPYLVKDINPGKGYSIPSDLTAVNGRLFFSAEDGSHGTELWQSDSSESGTVLVKDIYPGEYSSFPYNLTDVNGTLFFVANDGINGEELWRSDGTQAGTKLVKDILPGSGSSNPENLTAVNGTLFFTADDGIHGYELWQSDGTQAGTKLVKDVNPGGDSSSRWFLIAVNDRLFFSVNDGIHGEELWRSDGTQAGTALIKDICVGSCSSITGYFQNMIALNGTLFFFAEDEIAGRELWQSDGTAAGTVIVKDICPGVCDSSADYNLQNMTVMNGTLYFIALEVTHGAELWRTDGTEAGTLMVKDITPGVNSSFSDYYYQEFAAVNGTLFFNCQDGIHGIELWRSDGTEAGTLMVKDINPGKESSSPIDLTPFNGRLFFAASTAPYGDELWQSDGTEAGTLMVKDIFPGANSSSPEYLTAVNGRLFFTAKESYNDYYFNRQQSLAMSSPSGVELWSLGYFTNLPLFFNAFPSDG